ncbi:hypothetical protein MON38_02205 [Hymenobacter sp. DH14]|uniref:Uncharacterized protein n=1 Tax=Hymenobacter cyanobacteriorum TaxID=2926463 RepID=A0A9X2ADK8_9BACT|nr:hypothetical protein [Hymenobacter cyanobacteriorum]MCI1186216.1 hypothetical protein [Hymenobacter cyanobacteriorum]
MAILENLTKAAKGFFVEEDGAATAPIAPAASAPAPAPLPTAGTGPQPTQPEQRHRDHIAGLLASDGKDFGTYTKMVNSMGGSGLSGPLLYQTAFNAFSALTSTDLPALLASADTLQQKLADDRAQVQQRHREKLGESANPQGPPSPLVQLLKQESQLQSEVAALTEQLAAKRQQLTDLQQQAQAERQKTQAALASYELAHAAAAAELQAHRQATQSFLTPTPSR